LSWLGLVPENGVAQFAHSPQGSSSVTASAENAGTIVSIITMHRSVARPFLVSLDFNILDDPPLIILIVSLKNIKIKRTFSASLLTRNVVKRPLFPVAISITFGVGVLPRCVIVHSGL